MKKLIIISLIVLSVASCTSTPPLSVSEEVRMSSQIDDKKFRAVAGAPGFPGTLSMLDGSQYPNTKKREIVEIEVLPLRDQKQKTRFERWHIQHDQGEIVCYLVKIPVEGQATYYSKVARDRECKNTGF